MNTSGIGAELSTSTGSMIPSKCTSEKAVQPIVFLTKQGLCILFPALAHSGAPFEFDHATLLIRSSGSVSQRVVEFAFTQIFGVASIICTSLAVRGLLYGDAAAMVSAAVIASVCNSMFFKKLSS